jgi:hypothetical protein
MKKMSDSETEDLINSAKPKPAPAGLREKVVGAAARSRAADSATTPLLRFWITGCAVVILVISVADAFVTRNQSAHIQFMLAGPLLNSDTTSRAATADEELTDPLLEGMKANRLRLIADGKGAGRTHMDFRNIEKRILREESNGN